MFKLVRSLVWMLTITLAASENDGGSSSDSGASNTPDQGGLRHPLATLTAEGYDQMLERQRNKSKEMREQIAEYERRLPTASEDDRPMIEQGIATLRTAVAGWEQTIADAEALRPGGELVESRLADIEAAKGK